MREHLLTGESDPESNVAIVIVGASGDLAKRKLLPAIAALYEQGKIDDTSIVVGTGRTPYTDESFRTHAGMDGPFSRRLFYHSPIVGLRRFLDSKGTFSRYIFFLAQPPEAVTATARMLCVEGLGPRDLGGTVSIIIEKPFGRDFASAHALNEELGACFDESRIFRIDHYLAKESVQNILVFRFANTVFEPVWCSRYVESIQISALEKMGIFERGAYFDRAGILRDMVQNHLFQLLSLLTMEAPASLAPDDIARRKIELLSSLSIDACRRCQYEGYHREKGVAAGSKTETYAELKLSIDNDRWRGVPVYLRTGKAADRTGTEIGVRLREVPRTLFNEHGEIPPNRVIFKIQPAAGIILDLSSKVPGRDGAVAGTHMNFCYRDAFAGTEPDAYARLLHDAIRGDRTLFVSQRETEIAWKVLEPSLDKGDVTRHTRGTLPSCSLGVEWIDFSRYAGMCG